MSRTPLRIVPSQHASEENLVLYQDKSASVTPSWLLLGDTRYAIRIVARLDYKASHPPREDTALAVFFFAIPLVLYSVYRFTTKDLPLIVPSIMLSASAGLLLVAAWRAFRPKSSSFRVLVTMMDGSQVPIPCSNKGEADGLLDGLTRAMDWHRSDDVVLEAERNSHVRRSIARSGRGEAEGTAQSEQDAAALSNSEKSAIKRKVRRLMPTIAGVLRGKS